MIRYILPLAVLITALASPARAEMVSTEQALGEMSVGKKDAPVTIYAFESLTCPHCAAFHAGAYKQLRKVYIDTGKARIVYRDFPLDQRAFLASMVARCLGPAKYSTMIDTLFANQRTWAYVSGNKFVATLGGYARLAGMTGAEYEKCIRDKKLAQGLFNQRRDAARMFNIRSTPTFIIGKTRIEGAQPFAAFKAVIDPLVAAAPARKPSDKPAPKKDATSKKDESGKKDAGKK
jgi:protein-disulfide isomerase